MTSETRWIVLTTEGSSHGIRFLNALKRAGLRPAAVAIQRNALGRQWRLFRSVARRIGWLDAAFAALKSLEIGRKISAEGRWRGEELIRDYTQLTEQVIRLPDFRSEASLEQLAELHADYFFLAQTGIVKDPLLRLARLGVLNAHPGWLPHFRGVDLPWWTFHEGRPELLGSSLHFVDAGVDTGPSVWIQPFHNSTKPDFDLLEHRLYEDCIDLLVRAAREVSEGRELPRTPQESLSGKQFFKMSRASRRQARIAYDNWKNDAQRAFVTDPGVRVPSGGKT